MKKIYILALMSVFVFTIACKSDKKEANANIESGTDNTEAKKAIDPSANIGKKVWVVLNSKSGSKVTGNVIFEQEDGRVSMTAVADGLESGLHAIHLHEKSDCSSEDATSTGGHWNPTGQPHGKWGATEGYHKGDIGNFTVNDSGQGTITFATDEWCIGCGDETKDILGKAVIIHQGVDDFTSQPSGAAGSRVSCGGVIE